MDNSCGSVDGVSADSKVGALEELELAGRTLLNYAIRDKDPFLLTVSIKKFRQVLELRPAGDPNRGITLNNIAAALSNQFMRNGNIEALSEAIQYYREALSLHPPGHRARVSNLSNLLRALVLYFQKVDGKEEDFAEAVTLGEEALQYRPLGDPARVSTLVDVANILSVQSTRFNITEPLQRAIHYFQEALSLLPAEAPSRMSVMVAMAGAQLKQAASNDDKIAILEVISLAKNALDSLPPIHPQRGAFLVNLGSAHMALFNLSGDMNALTDAIDAQRRSMDLHSSEHPNHNKSLGNLASALSMKFEHTGEEKLLLEGIDLFEKALGLRHHGHPLRAEALNGLAYALRLHFQHFGDRKMLLKSVSLYEECLSLCRPHQRGRFSANYATALVRRYEADGDMETLAEAIRLYRRSLELQSEDRLFQGTTFNHLASALSLRFDQTRDVATLTESISLYRQSLLLRPPGHQYRADTLTNLSNALTTEYWCFNRTEALDEATGLLREVLHLRLPGHPRRSSSLNSLARVLDEQFEKDRNPMTLAETIELLQEAVRIHPQELHDHSILLYNLADALQKRYEQEGNPDDLLASLLYYCAVRDAHLEGHPQYHRSLHAIANVLLLESPYFSWEVALRYIELANSDTGTSAKQRLRSALGTFPNVERTLRRMKDNPKSGRVSQALELYMQIIRLLPQVAHFGLDGPSRLRELETSEDLSVFVAVRALLLGRNEIALEALEGGKSIFWKQMIDQRTPIDRIPPEYADKFTSLLTKLQRDDLFFSSNTSDKAATEWDIEERRRLNIEVEAMICDIRTRPGFENFLQIPPFNQLAETAARGPVVVLVITALGCFALVILDTSGSTKSIRLSVTLEMLRSMCNETKKLVLCSRGRHNLPESASDNMAGDPRGLNMERKSQVKTYNSHVVLETLWMLIVEPIIKAIGLQKAEGRDRPRICWYPTGDFTFLPLHAAGIYTSAANVSASDYIVSSYAPTLDSLIRSRANFKVTSNSKLKALLVAESSAPELPYLWNVEDEVRAVAGMLEFKSVCVEGQVGGPSSVKTVLEIMSTGIDILHLACHGRQEPERPLFSHFALRDGQLSIAELMRLKLQTPTLAFLSACETATGSSVQPNQAVHLAASLLFCGFRSVIGTMWSLGDEDGPFVAKEVYRQLLSKDTLELDDIPYALDQAVQKLRIATPSPGRWATYIHMGA